jgi:hypothetical protein
MTREQLNSLTEDEMAMLWFIINKVHPPVLMNIEMEPTLFTSINHRRLVDRVLKCKVHVKPQHMPVFDGLMNKLAVR